MKKSDGIATPQPKGVFATTHWSVVVAAGERDSPVAHEALSRLCTIYWYPLYAYVRRQGYRVEEAEDLTQEFFTRMLARNYIRGLDRQRRAVFAPGCWPRWNISWPKNGAMPTGSSAAAVSWCCHSTPWNRSNDTSWSL